MINTEYEAWTAIADTLEMIEDMPPYDEISSSQGFCDVIKTMKNDRVISDGVAERMDVRINRALREPPLGTQCPTRWRHPDLLAPIYHWHPRVELARRFAKESL